MRWSSLVSSGGGFCKSPETRVDFPDEGSPRRMICFEGIERVDETESRMEDHRSWGGASGDEGRELSMLDMRTLAAGGIQAKVPQGIRR